MRRRPCSLKKFRGSQIFAGAFTHENFATRKFNPRNIVDLKYSAFTVARHYQLLIVTCTIMFTNFSQWSQY